MWIKLLIAYLVPVAVIVAGMGYLAYRAARVAMEDQLDGSLTSVARTAADLLARPRALRLTPGDEQSRTYLTLKSKIEVLAKAAKVEAIYLFDLQGNALVDSDGHFSIGEPVIKLAANRAELKDVFKGSSRASVLFTGRQGRLFKTGFAPVVVDGTVQAAVGVDGSATFFGPLSEMGRFLTLMGVVALALVVLVTLLVSRGITRPVDRLARAAGLIGKGQWDSEISVETRDEIGLLARTLDDMRRSIKDRDNRLQMMLSGIAHEVRNPLGGMSLFVELLREDLAQDENASKHLARISAELDYLTRVVNDFLDFARKRGLEIESIDIAEECEQLSDLLAADMAQKKLSMRVDLDDGVEKIFADRERLRQALLNLLRNAIQASAEEGEINLSFSREGGDCVISIADQGKGIPEDRREKIFEPFYTNRQKGTGLGLALVKKIVDAHGGHISFSTETGAGTTFTIRLPEAR